MDYQKLDLNHPYLEYFKYYPKEYDPPQFLYVRGHLPDGTSRPKTAAIVGARRCTKYGENIAYNFAYQLAKRGVIIISGLAYGIDTCAHRGCLDAGGTTIAVLGTPIDQIYPRSNLSLGERILDRGAIVSEYGPGSVVYRENFLFRNRIVTGLADIVVIIEASDHSGTLYTAERGLEQGKYVYAVPGDISRPMSAGCHRLIAEKNCLVCTDVKDLLVGLHLAPTKDARGAQCYEKYRNCSPDELKIIAAIKACIFDPADIAKAAELDLMQINIILTKLEIDGLIIRGASGFSLA